MKKGIVCLTLVFFLLSCRNTEKDSATTDSEKTKTTKSDSIKKNQSILVCFGNSLTAGYGLEKEMAYPALIQKKLDSLKINIEVINAGISGETTAGGLSRLDWTLKKKVDYFILELGGNDGLRGIPTEETEKNLESIIRKVKQKSPDVKILLAGMKVPPNMGAEYGDKFEVIFPRISEKTNVNLIPFFLKGVAGDPLLNQEDGIHPTEEGAKIVANNVWEVLEGLIVE